MPRKARQIADDGIGEPAASMRPGLLCPGSNQRRRPRRPAHCFNEAGAFMPRKVPGAHDVPWAVLASMRPGLLCPGRRLRFAAPSIRPVLQ